MERERELRSLELCRRELRAAWQQGDRRGARYWALQARERRRRLRALAAHGAAPP